MQGPSLHQIQISWAAVLHARGFESRYISMSLFHHLCSIVGDVFVTGLDLELIVTRSPVRSSVRWDASHIRLKRILIIEELVKEDDESTLKTMGLEAK